MSARDWPAISVRNVRDFNRAFKDLPPSTLRPLPPVPRPPSIAGTPAEYAPERQDEAWHPITEWQRPPDNRPILIRVHSRGVDYVRPMFYHHHKHRQGLPAFRHQNVAPYGSAAWLEAPEVATHWRAFPRPALPEPRYAVERRDYVYTGGAVSGANAEISYSAIGSTFPEAVAALELERARERVRWLCARHFARRYFRECRVVHFYTPEVAPI